MLEALEKSAFAQTIAQSQMITASLSALHVIGFAMVTSGALLIGLRALGRLFPDRPVFDVVRPAARLLSLGVSMNIISGALLFSPRASSALANDFFRAKMLLLVSAILVQVLVMRTVVRRARSGDAVGLPGLAGAACAALWLAGGVAGAAFILIE